MQYNVIFLYVITITTVAASKCGRPEIKPDLESVFKISGGDITVPFSWPWQTHIEVMLVGGKTFTCGGSLINSRWVVSAAHCFALYDVAAAVLKFGVWDISKFETGSQTRIVTKSSVIVHPEFQNTSINDLALIKLPTEVSFTNHIVRVCLPRHDDKVNKPGKELIATGWGQTHATGTEEPKLRQVTVPIRPADQDLGCKHDHDFVKEKQLCAGGGGNPKKGICEGDSGGPLVKMKRNRWFQYGVGSVMGGEKCQEDPNNADVYTRMAHYCTWIEETIGKSICRPKQE